MRAGNLVGRRGIMLFINECGCKFDSYDLTEAVILQAKEDGKQIKEIYRITLRGDYPALCIAHKHYRIHSLLGKYYYGKTEAIHHIDGDKLNAMKSNLEPLTSAEHTRKHELHRCVSEEHKKNFGNRVAHIIRRDDVTCDKVKELRLKGMTIPQIAEELNSGYNTVCRRIKAIDWSDTE